MEVIRGAYPFKGSCPNQDSTRSSGFYGVRGVITGIGKAGRDSRDVSDGVLDTKLILSW